jgi:hypothetical protein
MKAGVAAWFLTCAWMPVNATQILTVRPIQVCDSASLVCGDPAKELFASATDMIFSQAGVSVQYLAWGSVTAPASVYSNMNTFDALGALNPFNDANTVVLWLAPYISSCGVAGSFYGCAPTPGSQVGISNDVFSYSSAGRIDTFAHELGHSLGLLDCSYCDKYNLEALGSVREIPQNLIDISPAGQDDQLSASQIEIMQSSRLLVRQQVPEPAAASLTAVGLAALWIRRSGRFRRRRGATPGLVSVIAAK